MTGPLPLHLRHRELPFWFEYLPSGDLVYFQFNAVRDHPAETFAAFCDRLFGFIEDRTPAARHRHAVERRRQHATQPAAAASPDRQQTAQPARRAVRHHRPADVLGGTEHRYRHRTRDQRDLRRRTHRVAAQLHRRADRLRLPYSKVRANAADLFWQTSWPTDYRTWTRRTSTRRRRSRPSAATRTRRWTPSSLSASTCPARSGRIPHARLRETRSTLHFQSPFMIAKELVPISV